MNLVAQADHGFIFLFFWEFMSRAPRALAAARHRDRENARGGDIYLARRPVLIRAWEFASRSKQF